MNRAWVVERATRAPYRTALVHDGDAVSFGELAAGTVAVAGRLLTIGVRERDRVAVLMAPSRRVVELLHAAQCLGVILAPLNLRLREEELAAQIERLRPVLLLHDREHETVARSLRSRVPGVRVLDAGAELDAIAPAELPDRRPAGDDVLTILFTSGTSAAAKAVILTNRNHEASARATMENLGLHDDDHWLCCLPLFHVGGLSILLRSAICGFTVVLHQRFEAGAANAAITANEVTIVSLVPTMLVRMLADAGERRYGERLRAVFVGGGPLSTSLVERAERQGIPVVATYGLTETASQVTATAPGETWRYPGSAGRPLDGVSLRIEGADGSGVGEILVQAPQVMAGYLDAADVTARALESGWLRTGDLGRMDDAGRLFVVTRRADLIITGGEKVVPDEVEAVLIAHPDIADVGVYARPDLEWGQQVCAAVVVRNGAAHDEKALRAWCAARLAAYKVPRRITFTTELPRTSGGKLRRALLEQAARRS